MCNPNTPMPKDSTGAGIGAGTRVYTAKVVVWMAMWNFADVDPEMKSNCHGYQKPHRTTKEITASKVGNPSYGGPGGHNENTYKDWIILSQTTRCWKSYCYLAG